MDLYDAIKASPDQEAVRKFVRMIPKERYHHCDCNYCKQPRVTTYEQKVKMEWVAAAWDKQYCSKCQKEHPISVHQGDDEGSMYDMGAEESYFEEICLVEAEKYQDWNPA